MSKWTKIIEGDKSTYPEKNGIYLCRFDTTKDAYCLSQFVNGEFEQHIISYIVYGEVMDEDAYDVISWCEIPTDENSNEFPLTEEFYKNGLRVFCNPCEKHSGENTPTPELFWEKYSNKCLICLVDENEELKRKILADQEKACEGCKHLRGCHCTLIAANHCIRRGRDYYENV